MKKESGTRKLKFYKKYVLNYAIFILTSCLSGSQLTAMFSSLKIDRILRRLSRLVIKPI